MTTEIVIKRTITIIERVPFGTDTYVNCDLPADAVEFEQGLPLVEKVNCFIDYLNTIPLKNGEDNFQFSEEVTSEETNG